jgi:hypothetical protein
MPEKNNIYTAMAAILADLGPISKDGKNTMQNYNFRGIEQLCAHFHSLLSNHGVFMVPEVLDYTREIVDRYKNGQVVGKMYTTVSRIKYTFYATDGSSVSAVTLGEGSDFSDKASNKAMSAALKYAFNQCFCVSDFQIDSEDESPEAGAPPTPEAPAPDAPQSYSTEANAVMQIAARDLKNHPPLTEADFKSIHGQIVILVKPETLKEGINFILHEMRLETVEQDGVERIVVRKKDS